jgi:hypothetical protein
MRQRTIEYQGIEVTYCYSEAVPEATASYACAGVPAWDAELEIVAAELSDLVEWHQSTEQPLPEDLLEWARETAAVEDYCWEHATEEDSNESAIY